MDTNCIPSSCVKMTRCSLMCTTMLRQKSDWRIFRIVPSRHSSHRQDFLIEYWKVQQSWISWSKFASGWEETQQGRFFSSSARCHGQNVYISWPSHFTSFTTHCAAVLQVVQGFQPKLSELIPGSPSGFLSNCSRKLYFTSYTSAGKQLTHSLQPYHRGYKAK